MSCSDFKSEIIIKASIIYTSLCNGMLCQKKKSPLFRGLISFFSLVFFSVHAIPGTCCFLFLFKKSKLFSFVCVDFKGLMLNAKKNLKPRGYL